MRSALGKSVVRLSNSKYCVLEFQSQSELGFVSLWMRSSRNVLFRWVAMMFYKFTSDWLIRNGKWTVHSCSVEKAELLFGLRSFESMWFHNSSEMHIQKFSTRLVLAFNFPIIVDKIRDSYGGLSEWRDATIITTNCTYWYESKFSVRRACPKIQTGTMLEFNRDSLWFESRSTHTC